MQMRIDEPRNKRKPTHINNFMGLVVRANPCNDPLKDCHIAGNPRASHHIKNFTTAQQSISGGLAPRHSNQLFKFWTLLPHLVPLRAS